jgi:hypothetical protein
MNFCEEMTVNAFEVKIQWKQITHEMFSLFLYG